MNNAFTPPDQKLLLQLARQAISEVTSSSRQSSPVESVLSPVLLKRVGCFVTLTRGGRLRGCIGNIFPRKPLYREVMNNACGAAFRDHRFPPMSAEEHDEVAIKISVLNEPVTLPFQSPEELLQKLRPGVDGVVLRIGEREATLLPQVWEQFRDASGFMDLLAQKARLPGAAWCDPAAVVMTYQVESFEEQRGV